MTDNSNKVMVDADGNKAKMLLMLVEAACDNDSMKVAGMLSVMLGIFMHGPHGLL